LLRSMDILVLSGATKLSSLKFVDEAGTFNTYSQFGEDAVTSLAFNRLGITRGFVVEFGAGDGLHLSNTALYWRERAWPALLIEPDPERYESLLRRSRDYSVRLHNAYVRPYGDDTIDSFLWNNEDVDFMSIDVDDCEYQIFENMEARPKLVLIEFNPTMPHHLEIVGDIGSSLQSSPLALVSLAERKGYKLLSITGCNCLFVREDCFKPFEKYNTRYEDLVDPNATTYMVSDWHGRYFHIGPVPFGMIEPYENPQYKQL
jgi:hypothetical protein